MKWLWACLLANAACTGGGRVREGLEKDICGRERRAEASSPLEEGVDWIGIDSSGDIELGGYYWAKTLNEKNEFRDAAWSFVNVYDRNGQKKRTTDYRTRSQLSLNSRPALDQGSLTVAMAPLCNDGFWLFKYAISGLEKQRHALDRLHKILATAVTPSGETYVLAALKFDSGGDTVFDEGSLSLQRASFDATFEFVLLKYEGGGALLWRRNLSTLDLVTYAFGLALDATEQAVYVAGELGQGANGQASYVVDRYDGATGQPVWRQSVADPAEDAWTGIRVGNDGGVYLFGDTEATPGRLARDLRVVRFAPDDSGQRSTKVGTAEDDHAFDLAIAADGSMFLAGTNSGQVGFGLEGANPEASSYVMRLDANDLVWSQQFQVPGGGLSLRALAISDDQRLIVGGVATSSFAGLPHEGGHDLVLLELDPASGQSRWSSQHCDCRPEKKR